MAFNGAICSKRVAALPLMNVAFTDWLARFYKCNSKYFVNCVYVRAIHIVWLFDYSNVRKYLINLSNVQSKYFLRNMCLLSDALSTHIYFIWCIFDSNCTQLFEKRENTYIKWVVQIDFRTSCKHLKQNNKLFFMIFWCLSNLDCSQ